MFSVLLMKARASVLRRASPLLDVGGGAVGGEVAVEFEKIFIVDEAVVLAGELEGGIFGATLEGDFEEFGLAEAEGPAIPELWDVGGEFSSEGLGAGGVGEFLEHGGEVLLRFFLGVEVGSGFGEGDNSEFAPGGEDELGGVGGECGFDFRVVGFGDEGLQSGDAVGEAGSVEGGGDLGIGEELGFCELGGEVGPIGGAGRGFVAGEVEEIEGVFDGGVAVDEVAAGVAACHVGLEVGLDEALVGGVVEVGGIFREIGCCVFGAVGVAGFIVEARGEAGGDLGLPGGAGFYVEGGDAEAELFLSRST